MYRLIVFVMLIVVLSVLENSKQIDNFLQMCYNVIQKKEGNTYEYSYY